jgi:hypothetical protein
MREDAGIFSRGEWDMEMCKKRVISRISYRIVKGKTWKTYEGWKGGHAWFKLGGQMRC